MTPAAAGHRVEPRPRFARVAIVGLGLIGGSLALAARGAGVFGRVIGVGRSRANLDEGLTRGAIDEATDDAAAAVIGADLVVLGVPVASMTSVVRAMLPSLGADAIVTDVGSVKAPLVADLDELLAGHARFVGGHPIAGTERSGMAAAFGELFRGRCCVLTPSPRTDPAALAKVRSLWEAVGMRVVDMDAARHDRVLAMVSHLPHVVAYALAGEIEACEAAGEELVPFSAGGLKDFTRVAASDPALWRDIFTMNRDEVAAGIRAYRERLERLEGLIRDGRGDELREELERARSLRRRVES
ncbi:MAG: prephenate dehydrogenase/arogenate dehydrogenase family protein [Deltaproteobacteria bacterium]|nr:prephenate dehydrogenase/arogenate dehydrogenase family protein [Deltaproteobacteria bacterium]